MPAPNPTERTFHPQQILNIYEKIRMQDQLAQTVGEVISSKAGPVATFGGSALSIFGGFNDWNMVATLGGIVVGVCGLCMNWYYKYKQDLRQQSLYKLAMKLRNDHGVRVGDLHNSQLEDDA